MAPLKAISSRAHWWRRPPGLIVQYTELVARFTEGAANAEFVAILAFYSFP